jgi:hypothetical protein
MAEVSEEFGRAIRQILERHSVGGKKMSYRNAQAKTGVNYQTIQNMEQGIIPLRVEFIRKFADGFKEPRSSLMLSTPNFKPTVRTLPTHQHRVLRTEIHLQVIKKRLLVE